MRMQYDNKNRVVLLANLEAICKRVSGTCHRYQIESVNKAETRVSVSYSNPDEYGAESPMIAVFPAFPSREKGNPHVVLDHFLAVRHDNWHGEGWQAFHPVCDGPVLWRDPSDGEWRTEDEVKAKQAAQEDSGQ